MLKGQPAPDPAGPCDPAGDGTLIEDFPARAGRYLLRELIGRGSMGEVWRGEDPEIARPVAIKLLQIPAGLSETGRNEWEQRFLREARAAGRLSHPGIVPVHDVGTTDDGRPFIVMELVEGLDLEAILRKGQAPPPAKMLIWGAQIAEALDAAHRRGIVHRDIKPANILIDEDGRAHVTDFGIARMAESDLTREGLFLGSPAYASPEQLRGETVDGRSDLFSLGSSLYAGLTGVKPFRGEELSSLAYAICHVEPAPPSHLVPGLPRQCDAILARTLAKEPKDRYQTGGELSVDFRAALQDVRASIPPHDVVVEQTWRGQDAVSANSEGSTRQIEFERRAAAFGSDAGALMARATVAALTAGRALIRRSRESWARGWAMGPRIRAAMITGLIVVLTIVSWGGFTVINQIVEARRETPARKLKKAWKSLVGEMKTAPPDRNPGEVLNQKDEPEV